VAGMSHIATLDPILAFDARPIGEHLRPWAHPKLKSLYDYWLQRRPDASRLPSRRDIDPADFPKLLGNVFLLNVNEEEPRFTYRVAGQKLSWLHQVPLTGRPLGTGLTEQHRAIANARAMDVVHRREPAWRNGDLGWCGRGYLDFQELILPLDGPEGDVAMLFGILVVIDPAGKEC
jgi:hypothetical protein